MSPQDRILRTDKLSEEELARSFSAALNDKTPPPAYSRYEGRPVTVYIADLLHDYTGQSVFSTPLNIGYMATYARKQLGDNIQCRLFKFANALIEAVEAHPPDVIAMSNYVWNMNLGLELLRKFKTRFPNTLTLMGGPNVDLEYHALKDFMQKNPFLDVYVSMDGETGFAAAVNRFIECDFDVVSFKSAPVPGCDFIDPSRGILVSGSRHQLAALDDIPSPFLSGFMDDFMVGSSIPLIETNRGCPYTCTFCTWGHHTANAVTRFSMERVCGEIEYIARHCQGTAMDILMIADANFGMFSDRDLEISNFIRKMSEQYLYPKVVRASWAKNKTDKLLLTAEALKDMVPVTVALQSMDKGVLRNIKRSNMKMEHFEKLQEYFTEKGVSSHVQMILGLPGETRGTHLDALSNLLEKGNSDINCYNCMLLKGSEMNSLEQREKYQIKSGWRLVENSFGKYGDVLAIEPEEIVLETSTMSREDMLFFRPLHWLIQFLHCYGYYSMIFPFFRSQGIPIIDFFVNLVENASQAPEKAALVFQEFLKEAREEFFKSSDALIDFYKKEENWKKLAEGEQRKMGAKYISRVLLECKEDFESYLAVTARDGLRGNPNADVLGIIMDEIIRYDSCRNIDFFAPNLFEGIVREFQFDIHGWQESGYEKDVLKYYTPTTYCFYLSEEHQARIQNFFQVYDCSKDNFKRQNLPFFYYFRAEGMKYKVKEASSVNARV